MRTAFVVTLATGSLLVCSCTTSRPSLGEPAAGPMTVRPSEAGLDPAAVPADVHHVIVGIDSLERGIRLLREATGLSAVYGGTHPGRGTQNALLGLGHGRYLELLAPNPADTSAAAQALGVAGRLQRLRTLTPFGWALATRDADSLRRVLVARGLPGGSVTGGARQRADGATVRWRSLGMVWGLRSRMLPFFVEDDHSGPPLAATAPSGCTLVGLTLAAPQADTIRALLSRAQVRVSVTAAPEERISLVLACPTGRVQLPAGGAP